MIIVTQETIHKVLLFSVSCVVITLAAGLAPLALLDYDILDVAILSQQVQIICWASLSVYLVSLLLPRQGNYIQLILEVFLAREVSYAVLYGLYWSDGPVAQLIEPAVMLATFVWRFLEWKRRQARG